MKKKLTIDNLKAEAKAFCIAESKIQNKSLFGITDGKAVGTHIEHKFQEQLTSKYKIAVGSSASGIDLPSEDILTDSKVTSIKQPQSSCPFKDANKRYLGRYNYLFLFTIKQIIPKLKLLNSILLVAHLFQKNDSRLYNNLSFT